MSVYFNRETSCSWTPNIKDVKETNDFLSSAIRRREFEKFDNFLERNPDYKIPKNVFKETVNPCVYAFLERLLDHDSLTLTEERIKMLQTFLNSPSKATPRQKIAMWKVIFTHQKIKEQPDFLTPDLSKKVLDKALTSNHAPLIRLVLDHPAFELTQDHAKTLLRYLSHFPRFEINDEVWMVLFTHPKVIALFAACLEAEHPKKEATILPILPCSYLVCFAKRGNEQLVEIMGAFVKQVAFSTRDPTHASILLLNASEILMAHDWTVEEIGRLFISKINNIWTYALLHSIWSISQNILDAYFPLAWLNEETMKEAHCIDMAFLDTPLILLCRGEDDQSVTRLLSFGVDPNIRSSDEGKTALYYACENGYLPIVKALIDAKATYTDIDESGKNIYLQAAKGHKLVVNYLNHLLQ